MTRTPARTASFLALLAVLALPVLLGSGCVSERYAAAKAAPNDAELGARLVALGAAYDTMDVAKITPFYAPDAYELSFDTPLPFSTGGAEHAQVLTTLLGKLRSLRVEWAPTFDAWRDGNRAWTNRQFTLTGVTNDGAPLTYRGWHSAVWEKRAGTWLVWYEHFGGGPQPAKVAAAAVPPPLAAASAPAAAPTPAPFNFADVFFDLNRAEIRVDQLNALAEDVRFLQAHPDLKVVIEGHCDERGGERYNDGLGDRRAEAVKAYLVAHGIAADRLATVSFGKRKPFELGSGEQVWQANRRAHFVVAK